jgi:hypothetical protein
MKGEKLSSSVTPYPARPGANIEKAIQTFDSEPEINLSPEEVQEVKGFEERLTRGKDLQTPDGEPVEGIENIWASKINSAEFYLDYFLTDDGRAALEKLLPDAAPAHTIEDAKKILAGIDYSKIDSKVLEKIEGDSIRQAEAKMCEQFAQANYASVEKIQNPEKMTVIRNPDVLADKIHNLRLLKECQKFEEKKLNEEARENSGVVEAKNIMLTIHRRRLNELLVETYAEAVALIGQHQTTPTAFTQAAVEKILQEKGIKGFNLFQEDNAARAFSRLDKFRYGADAQANDQGDFSPISADALAFADAVEQLATPSPSLQDYYFKGGDVNLQAIVTAEEWSAWAKIALQAYGLLSASEEYSSDRAGMASDGKWQIALDAKVKNLGVDPQQGVVKVPEKFKRAVGNLVPAGAASVLDHELAHVLQHENKRRLGTDISLMEKVGMDRSSLNAEAGALAWEGDAKRALFGQETSVNTHYLRAAQAKLRGGSYKECAKAFFDSVVKADLNISKDEAAGLAFNRTARLFRRSGDLSNESSYLTNSQPLVYLEQELVARQLREKGKTELLMIGGANIEMLAELKRVGMLDLSKLFIPDKRPSEINIAAIEGKVKSSVV